VPLEKSERKLISSNQIAPELDLPSKRQIVQKSDAITETDYHDLNIAIDDKANPRESS
jgi:hypothetical protein